MKHLMTRQHGKTCIEKFRGIFNQIKKYKYTAGTLLCIGANFLEHGHIFVVVWKLIYKQHVPN